ncbi:MAG: hypothetical protein ACJ790_19615 [Myxococcaceae bacterium]
MSFPGSVAVQEIFEQAFALCTSRWLWFLAALLVTLALFAIERLTVHRSAWRAIPIVVTCFSVLVGGFLASRVAWLADDAYISFRYARNLALGNGVVFNPGEWVEGYTNFLWTAVLAGLARLGADIPYAALAGCFASFVVVLVLTSSVLRRLGFGRTFPFSVVILGASSAMSVWATSGLETMFVMALVLGATRTLISSLRWRRAVASLLFAAAAMARPDQVLTFSGAGVALAVCEWLTPQPLRRRLLALAEFGAPFVVVYGSYFLLRWHAYGDLFPNTYYAKSGGATYLEQGIPYLALFVTTTGACVWIPIAVATGSWRLSAERRLFVMTSLLGSAALLVYVGKVGGDFMLNRFCMPALPLLLICAEVALRDRFARERKSHWTWRWVSVGAAAVAIAFAVVPMPVIGPFEKKWNVAEEDSFYRIKAWKPLQVDSRYFYEAAALTHSFTQRGLMPRYAVGCIGMIGYYSGLPIIDTYGLTSRRIAHEPIAVRGRPGHEKRATLEDLLAENAALAEEDQWHEPDWRVVVDGLEHFLVRWDDALMNQLRAIPGAQVPTVQRLVEQALSSADFEERRARLESLTVMLGDAAGAREALDAARAQLRVAALSPLDERSRAQPLNARRPDGALVPIGYTLTSTPDATSTARYSVEIASGESLAWDAWCSSGSHARLSVSADQGSSTPVEARCDELWNRFSWTNGGASSRLTLTFEVSGVGVPAAVAFRNLHLVDGGQKLVTSLARASERDFAAAYRRAWLELPGGAEALERMRSCMSLHEDFDEGVLPSDVRVTGSAFALTGRGERLPGQTAVSGVIGAGYLNGFHGGDASVGTLTVPLPPENGWVDLLVGGGADCSQVNVSLVVNGRATAIACGKNDEVLRPVHFQYAAHAGDVVALVAKDTATGGWGHLLLDDVLVGTDAAFARCHAELAAQLSP